MQYFLCPKLKTIKKPPEGGLFIIKIYFNKRLFIRLMYSAGSSGKPPSAINA